MILLKYLGNIVTWEKNNRIPKKLKRSERWLEIITAIIINFFLDELICSIIHKYGWYTKLWRKIIEKNFINNDQSKVTFKVLLKKLKCFFYTNPLIGILYIIFIILYRYFMVFIKFNNINYFTMKKAVRTRHIMHNPNFK